MILADSSVWIDHFRSRDDLLSRLIATQQLLLHPFVVGELSLGSLKDRALTIRFLNALPQAPVARIEEVSILIEQERLFGCGLGYVDIHLVASAMLARCTLWTRDARLHGIAVRLGIAS